MTREDLYSQVLKSQLLPYKSSLFVKEQGSSALLASSSRI